MANSSFYSGTGTNPTDVDSITSSKTAAETAATNAATSEANAALSAVSASTSATNASNSASSISGSVAAAASSATDSANSATSSATSSAEAANSASSASTSATNASTSAASATSSASSAANSALDASGSATQAASSAASASTSASNAATSEANSATSATQAAASAATAQAAASNTDVATVSSNVSYVQSVADNISDVETVSNNVLKINNVADNISGILAANTASDAAATSASEAATSASSAASSASSASSAQSAAESARDATLAAYDNFDDRYLGSFTSDPTTDNDGNALVAGSIYFNSTDGAMKVYTGSAWVAAYVNGADYLALSGGTLTGTLNLGDNVKAQFGASADLQIWHAGYASFIDDVGTGNLNIRAENLNLQNPTGNENYIRMNHNGSVDVYYDNSKKLETTSSGINVTGTVVADGAQIDLSSSRQIKTQIATSGSSYGAITCVEPSASNLRGLELEGQLLRFGTNAYNQTTSVRRMQINDAGEAIFYEDTGADAKMRWLPTNERLRFEDTVRATFGASDDLQIYHDGNNSYVSDQGQGVLYIQGSNNVQIESATGENMAVFLADNAVELYYDNSKKLETTSSGVKVYDRLNVDLIQSSSHGASSELDFDDDVDPFGTGQANFTTLRSIGGLNLVFDTNNNDTNGFFIGQNSGDTSLATKHFFINGLGDISFYEDTGTTAKFFWDASTERLGIGTTSPAYELDVEGQAWIRGNTQGIDDLIHLGEYSDGSYPFSTIGYDDVSGDRLFFDVNRYGAQFTMRRDSAAGADIKMMQVGGNGSTNLTLYDQANPSTSTSVTEKVKLHTDGSSYFTGGNVGIGTTAPNSAADLHIHSTSGTALWLTSNGGNPSDAGFIRMSEQLDGSGAYFELQHDGSNNMLNLYSSNQGGVIQSWSRVGGDTNFHNSSGTAKLTWSAADEELQLASGVALELNGWTITESGGSLYFATGGTNKMKLDASGNLQVVGSVDANATIT